MANSIDIKKYLKIKGRVRGDVLKTDFNYIKKKEGAAALKKLEKEIKKYGIDLGAESVKSTSWYPVGYKAIIFDLIEKKYNWSDYQFEKMGQFAHKESFIVRTLLRYFVSFQKTVEETPNFWAKYWSVGELVPYKLDEKEKYLILRLKNVNIHPKLCLYFKGHFKAIAGLIIKSEKLSIKETKCAFKDDKVHEYLIEW